MAAANGSTVGTAVASEDSAVGMNCVSVGEETISGVNVGVPVGDSVAEGRGIVGAGSDSVTTADEGDCCSVTRGGGATSVGEGPQLTTLRDAINRKRKLKMRPIYFPARRLGLRAVEV